MKRTANAASKRKWVAVPLTLQELEKQLAKPLTVHS
jgi:hypothetical protein